MKINWRKVWKVLRVIGEIGLAAYGVLVTILYNDENTAWWKEFRLNWARGRALADINTESYNPMTNDSHFRKFVRMRINKCDKALDAIEHDEWSFGDD